MNRTHVEHGCIAVVITLLVGILTGNWWAGTALAAGIFVGREHAQAEYRWIDRFAAGQRAGMPWWGGFDAYVWTLDCLLDLTVPLFCSVCVAFVAWLLNY